MTTTQRALPLVSVPDAARMIGVTPARVYQRIAGKIGYGLRLPAVVEPQTRNGKAKRPLLRVDVASVLQWRDERIAAGLTVGAVPPRYAEHVVPPPPARPVFGGDEAPRAIGMPQARPF